MFPSHCLQNKSLRPCGSSGSTLLVPAAPKVAIHGHKQPYAVAPKAAASAEAVTSFRSQPQQQLQDIIPYVSRHSPKLQSRRMSSNPAEELWHTVSRAVLRCELALAALVGQHAVGPFLMSALAGAMTGMGVDAVTLLRYGLPPYLPDLLLSMFGIWDTGLIRLGLTAAALPVTAWALRAWWAANMQLLLDTAGPLQQLSLQLQQQQQQGSGNPEQAAEAVSQQQQQQQQQEVEGSHWIAAAATIFRGMCLGAVVSKGSSLLASSSGSSSSFVVAANGFALVAAAAAATALLLLRQPLPGTSPTASISRNAQQPQLLLPLLAAELAWVVAMLGVSPLLNAAAAAGLAASVLMLHQAAAAPALLQYKVAAGDVVEAHVSLKLGGTRPVFDSTLGDEPLTLQAEAAPAEFVQVWQDAASGEIWRENDDVQQQQQRGDQPSDAAASSSSSSGKGLREVQQELQGWVGQPLARWDVLRPFIADTVQGMFLGETRSISLYNPRGVGYWNPSFTWWQPAADVKQKFGGHMPEVGDVFWYPVADGAAVPTQVAAVGQDYVQLDANYGVTDTPLELEVQLVLLQKQQQ